MEKSKDYYCDEGLEEFQDLFCNDIWSFCGKEILEKHKEYYVDVLFAQVALSSDEENGRGDSTRFALPKTDT